MKTLILISAAMLMASFLYGEENREGRIQYEQCIPCHGADGAGKEEIKTPAIAGLPKWYVEAQINKFLNGARGKHPDDIVGMRMRAMAKTIKKSRMEAVAQFVADMEKPELTPTLDGDPVAGQASYALCSSCHGPGAEGNQALSAPPLVMLNDWYLYSQLKNFKSGIRGSNPASDPTGAQMAPMAMTLPNDQAIKDVVAYIVSLRK